MSTRNGPSIVTVDDIAAIHDKYTLDEYQKFGEIKKAQDEQRHEDRRKLLEKLSAVEHHRFSEFLDDIKIFAENLESYDQYQERCLMQALTDTSRPEYEEQIRQAFQRKRRN